MKKYFLVLILLFLSTSISYSQYAHLEYLKKDKERKVLAKIKNCNEELDNNSKGLRSYQMFDSEGRLIFYKNWYNGKLEYERTYNYNANGLLEKMTNDKDKPYNLYTAYYYYDESGKLVSEIRVSKNKSDQLSFKFIYDADGNLVEEIFEQGSRTYYTYENDKMIKEEEFELNEKKSYATNFIHSENSIIEERINPEGEVTDYYEKKLDGSGNLVEIISYDKHMEVKYKLFYENDAFGNQLYEYKLDENGEKKLKKTFKYEYYE